ncbi:MAG TPA: DUF1232 domain-containing protein [Beijerinckiaceae bacterium]|jgi:uncharacterized membrane protein YkvA (DUF1232 family)
MGQRLAALKRRARELKREIAALAGAARDPRTPLPARLVALAVVAYALSPIDLIPDVIPVLGLLDDLVIVPLGLLLALRLIPAPILAEHRARIEAGGRLPRSRAGAAFVILLWVMSTVLVAWWLWP